MATDIMSAPLAAPHAREIVRTSDGPAATELAGAVARLGRWIKLLVAVSAMALMLAGTMATPAEAAPRSGMGTVAERCADVGGDPSVYGFAGLTFTYCDWGDGTGVWGVE